MSLQKHFISGWVTWVKQTFAQPLCRCPNKKVDFFLLCVYTNIYISHCCLFNKVSGSHPLLPSSFHFPELDAYRPKPCMLKDVSSLTCSWVPITWCHPWRRHTLLQQPCVNSLLLLKCLPGQRVPGVYTSSISTQIQVRCSL